MLAGILLGLGCAITQSIGYLFSRRFVLRHPGGPARLMVLAHVIMGVAALAGLPFFWPERMPPVATWIWPFVIMVGTYLLGQFGLFMAMRETEASRISPLLGLKIPMIAIWTVAFVAPLAPPQWLAVGLSLVAAALLIQTGGRLSWKTVGLILLTCVGYSLSDIHIVITVRHFENAGTNGPVFVACMDYTLAGLLAAALLPLAGKRECGIWLDAAPFAACWLSAILMLFGCLTLLGALFGNILQSTRGVLSVAIGVLVAHVGHVHLEQKVGRWPLARRIAAAALMVAAIALYALSRP